MPRENSFSDSDGRSLTPDLEGDDGGASPITSNPHNPPFIVHVTEPAPRFSQSIKPLIRHSIISEKHGATPSINHKAHPSPKALAPIERFRSAVRKIMALHRGTSYLTGMSHIGAEPGINPRRASANLLYGHIRQDCTIEIADYSSVRSTFKRMTNAEFINLLDDPTTSEPEPWAKVRWINIGGLSWDVIKAVSIKYDLHPLALEDVFQARSQNKSKADYYPKHLFLRILCHELGSSEKSTNSSPTGFGFSLSDAPRSNSPVDLQLRDPEEDVEDEGVFYGSGAISRADTMKKKRRFLPKSILSNSQHDPERALESRGRSKTSLSRLMPRTAAKRQKQVEHEITLDALKEGERVKVKVSPMFIFLLRDGTVISIHAAPNLSFTSAISQRLHQRDTGLRTSADPSLLVHAILDIIVDNALEVIDEYHTKINMFESEILLKPSMKTVRHLHILSGDLILHKRTLDPIRTLIYGLRRYDLDRCAALIDMSDPGNAGAQVVGFMSHKSKIYLADVYDHMEYILTSLDMFAGIAENLISYTFNLASYEMNQVMQRLTLATIIFLPLTLLTGYFGMNFDRMWSVKIHSDLLFWEIALPVMAFIIPLFMWSSGTTRCIKR